MIVEFPLEANAEVQTAIGFYEGKRVGLGRVLWD